MAAIVETRNYLGASAGGGATETHIRFKNIDDNAPDNLFPVRRPSSGTSPSWWKTIGLHCISAPDTSLGNVRIYPEAYRFFTASAIRDANRFPSGSTGLISHDLRVDTAPAKYFEHTNERYDCAFDPDGNYLYVIDRGLHNFEIWDTADHTNPFLLSSIELSARFGILPVQTLRWFLGAVLWFSTTYVLVLGCTVRDGGPAEPEFNIWVIDITTKTAPTEAKRNDHGGGLTENFSFLPRGIIDGNTLYAWLPTKAFGGESVFGEYDLTALPTTTKGFEEALGSIYDAPLTGDMVRSTTNTDIFVVSATDPIGDPEEGQIATIDISADPVITFDNSNVRRALGLARTSDDKYLFVCQGTIYGEDDLGREIIDTEGQITAYDFTAWLASPPLNPTPIGTLVGEDRLRDPMYITIHPERENIAYVTCGQDSRLTVIDIADPTNMVILGSYETNPGNVVFDVFLDENKSSLAPPGFHCGQIDPDPAWSGTTVYVGDETTSTYDEATGNEDDGDELVANHSQIAGKTDFYTYTPTSPKSVSGSIGATTGRVSDFVVFQLELTPTSPIGVVPKERWVWAYDEL